MESAVASDVAGLLDDLGTDVMAGIDAPLIVGANRRAEAELARAFGNRGVYAYAARQDFLERHGITEGPKLGKLLEETGWNLDAAGLAPDGRHALEVFPHATIVSLLGAERALRYKKGALGARIGPMSEFQARLRAYSEVHLPSLLSEPSELLTKPIGRTTGQLMKDLEDRLDAVACAIAAFHAHRFGVEGLSLFGDLENGYIAVPKPAATATSVPEPSFP
jgi:predicted RNase H-like nuclease